jgi:WD40 repeat protein
VFVFVKFLAQHVSFSGGFMMRTRTKEHRLLMFLPVIALFLGIGYSLSTSAHDAASAVTTSQRTPDIVWQGYHTSLVRAVAYSPNGQQLASGGDDHKTQVRQASDGTLLQTLVQCGGLRCGSTTYLAFSPDGQTLASNGGGLKLWRTSDGTLLRTLTFSEGTQAISPDWQYVVSSADHSSYSGNAPSTVTLFRLSDKSQIWQVSGGGGLEAAVSPDGQTVAAVGRNTGIDFWQVSNGAHLLNIPGPKHLLVFSPDGQYVASTQAAKGLYPYDHTIEIYRVSDGALVQTMLGTGAVDALAWTPDGQAVLSTGWEVGGNAQYGIIRLWRVSDGALLKNYDQGTGSYTGGIAVSADGKFFAYTQSDNSLTVARMPSFACAFSIDQLRATYQHEGGTGIIHVTAPEGCSWTAYSQADWVHITGGSSGTGNGTVTYSVDVGPCYTESPTGYYRDAILNVAEQTFDVNQNECPLGPGHYSIYGQVTDGGSCNVGIPGVTVTLSGYASANTQTDSGGFFSFDKQVGQQSYTVTPSKPGYAFSPQGKTIDKLTYDSAVIFNATTNPYPRHHIVGYVKDNNGRPLSGVTLHFEGAAPYPQQTYSDSNGFYGFSCLAYGGNFTITPEYAGYTFTPPKQAVNNLTSDQTVNFVAMTASNGCTPALSNTGATVASVGGRGSVSVTACGTPWKARSNARWIVITSGGQGTGDGTITYTVATNKDAAPRTGTISISEMTYTITQQASTTGGESSTR